MLTESAPCYAAAASLCATANRRRLVWYGESAAERRWDSMQREGAESMAWLNTLVAMLWKVPGTYH
jgi:hypothetical protein